MSNIFSELASLGFNNLGSVKLYEEEEKKNIQEADKSGAGLASATEAEYLFDKKMVCPVCDKEFKVKTVRAGKTRLVGSDSDLRPKYTGIDTIKYDVIVCPFCGYAAISRFYGGMSSFQINQIKQSICSNFKGIDQNGETYSYVEAITRYKLALLNAIVKKGKTSEKAYLCLKLAWLYRGEAETCSPDEDKSLIEDCKAKENEFIKMAYEGFTTSMSNENFPICGMDEMTYTYLLAELARKCGKYEESIRLVGRIIVSRTASSRLKDKARDLKDTIKEEIKNIKKPQE